MISISFPSNEAREITGLYKQDTFVGRIVKNRIIRVQNPQALILPSKNEKKMPGTIIRKGLGRQEFIKRIRKQIRLQKQLINLKHQITDSHKQGLDLCLNIQMFQMNPEELDPFFTSKHTFNTQILARELFIQNNLAQNHWKEDIVRRFDQEIIQHLFRKLKNEDLQESISIKRFAKELNTFFQDELIVKVKDVFSIYRRLSPFNHANFIEILVRKSPAQPLSL